MPRGNGKICIPVLETQSWRKCVNTTRAKQQGSLYAEKSPLPTYSDVPGHWGSQLISGLRKMAQKDFESMKNQRVYDRVLEEQEYE